MYPQKIAAIIAGKEGLKMLHIAIAGTQEGAENFITALNALGASGTPALEVQDFSGYDGLILPGGADIDPALFGEPNWGCRTIQSQRDIRQLEMLKEFVETGKPILGVCKGHQLLNVYFGGTVYQHIPQYLVHQWNDADQAHMAHCTEDSFLMKLYGASDFMINSAHHQAIVTPASCFTPIQWAPDGVLEAMVHKTMPIIGLQWHPERMCCNHRRPDTVDGLPIFEYFLSLCRES